ncbi:MAG: molybdopterin-synthase adenylyltransferase MoeB [Candidatus Latescibacterota bacterium]
MNELSSEEILRYQRHLTLPGFGEKAQRKLKETRVLVIGAGGLGCPALQYLAAAGVGTLGIVDDDRVNRSNLQRQILYTDAEVGQRKAEVAAARLTAMNPHITCVPYPTRLSVSNALDLIGAYDVILDGSDNFPTRYLVNDACVMSGKPFVYGALYTFEGQASVFNYQGGPTYRCLFPEPPDPKDAPNCSEIGVLGVLPGLIGVIQATEVIKLVTGVGEPLSGKLLLFDALTMSQHIVRFKRVPERAHVTELVQMDFLCGTSPEASPDEIDPEALRALLAKDTPCQLIDVREDWERAICRLESVPLPLAKLLAGQLDLEAAGLSPKLPTCVYCKSGVRSLKTLAVLRDRYGFTDLKSLRGGILAWAGSIDPAMRTY